MDKLSKMQSEYDKGITLIEEKRDIITALNNQDTAIGVFRESINRRVKELEGEIEPMLLTQVDKAIEIKKYLIKLVRNVEEKIEEIGEYLEA